MSFSKTITAGAIFIVALFILMAYFFWLSPSKVKLSEFETTSNEVLKLLEASDFSQAITKAQQAKNLAINPAEKELADFLFARALLGTNTQENMKTATEIFKSIAENQNNEPRRRASALVSIASIYINNPSGSLANEIVFNTEPYSTYLKDSGNDPAAATIKILDSANDIFPTDFAHSDIVTLARIQIHSHGINPADQTQVALAQKIIKSLASIETLQSDVSLVSEETIINRQVSKALSLGTAHYLLPQEVSNDQVDIEYDKALNLLASSPSRQPNLATMSLTYAASLQARQPDTKKERVVSLLEQVTKLGENDSTTQLAIARSLESNFTSSQMPKLAALDPNFAQFILKIQKLKSDQSLKLNPTQSME